MKTLDELKADRARLKEELDATDKIIAAEIGKTLVRCESSSEGKGCGMAMEVRELTYIQTHWYTAPHGCTGGDYWNQGEGQFVCIHCGVRNRLFDRKPIEALKYHFKDVKKEYDR